MSESVASRRQLRVGIVGAGMIATVKPGFLPGLQHIRDRAVVVAITSRTRSRAEAVARDWAIPAVYDSLAQMLAHANLDVVLNLTPIAAHYETSLAILNAGVHLVTEKPIASTVAQATDLCAVAADKHLQIVCAPYDMLKPEWAEARRLVRAGAVGKVAFARLQSSHGGPAAMAWPADPTWFYQEGAGPLLDMGVYGIDRITGILGPVRRVAAFSGLSQPVRYARGGTFDGLEITATVDDNTLLMLDFGEATFAFIDATFNVLASKSAALELYGSAGTLIVSRPGMSAGSGTLPIELFRADAVAGLSGWITPRSLDAAPPQDRTALLARAVLVEHLADCLDSGVASVAGADRARHVLEIMLAARTAAREGRTIDLETTFEVAA
jgi:predicted dehydrogenase